MIFTIYHNKKLKLSDLDAFIKDEDATVQIFEATKTVINNCRSYLDKKLKNNTTPIYGINTGFGALCDVVISNEDANKLQENLIKSHACGMGEEVPEAVVKLMLFLKIQSLSYGKSGVSLQTVEQLCTLINHKIYPVVYQQGSLGASGDLSPLAHLSLPLIGLGKVNYKNSRLDTKVVFEQKKINPIKLQSKEGLALLNGTQFMSAYGVLCLLKSKYLNIAADKITSLSIDSFDARIEPFKEKLHLIRAHAGQIETAKAIRKNLEGSELSALNKKQVQDPYSFRCVPQVHGATKDTVNYVSSVFETEINSVTDNPTIFSDEDEIISGGNFHGQPLAIALDFLCIAMAELASISERRTYLLISGQRNLPIFLTTEPGLNSGFMITQYTAASIVSQNKQLCTPASIDSITSSNGQEDHVSMGANAATKCHTVIDNVEKVLAIELLIAAQAIEFRRPLKSSLVIEEFITSFRTKVRFMKVDEIVYELMHHSQQFLKSHFNA